MNFLDTRLYRWMDVLADFFLLNVLWLLACIPLVSAFPATAALFAVMRDRVRGKESGLFGPFFRYMRENFAQSLVVGLIWTIVGLVLVVDFLVIRVITSWLREPLFVLFFVFALIYLGTAVYLFPVMVHYRVRWFQVIKNAFLIAFSSFGVILTLLSIVVSILAGLVSYYIPVSFLLIGSVTAYSIFYLCYRAFQKIEPLKDDIS